MVPDQPLERKARTRADRWLALAIAAGVLFYLYAWPRSLQDSDESYFLLEAKRIAAGEVLYRDIFWFAMPLAHWAMALVFAVFGATIDVARLAMAVVHATTALLIYTAARRGGARPVVALLPPFAFIALCHGPWPYATPHWFATAIMAAILAFLLGAGREPGTGRSLGAGLLVGILAATYQQKGAVFVVVIGALLALEAPADPAEPRGLAALRRRLQPFAGGVAIVVLPVLAVMLAAAGWDRVFSDVIVHPLTGYREANRAAWGAVNPISRFLADHTYPVVLKYLPLLFVPALARLVFLARRPATADARGEHRSLVSILAVCTAAALSVGYLPDFIHLAFIAPPFFVLAAVVLDGLPRWLGSERGGRTVGAVVASILVAALAAKATANLRLAWRQSPVSYESAFGRIDVPDAQRIELIDRMRQVLRDEHQSEMFVWPVYTSLYLTTGANNATPFQLLLPNFNLPQHYEETVAILEAKKVLFVVACRIFLTQTDPVLRYVTEHYDEEITGMGPFVKCTLYRRRAPAQR